MGAQAWRRKAAAWPWAMAWRRRGSSMPAMERARRCSSGASTAERSVLSVHTQARTPSASHAPSGCACKEGPPPCARCWWGRPPGSPLAPAPAPPRRRHPTAWCHGLCAGRGASPRRSGAPPPSGPRPRGRQSVKAKRESAASRPMPAEKGRSAGTLSPLRAASSATVEGRSEPSRWRCRSASGSASPPRAKGVGVLMAAETSACTRQRG